MGGEALAKFLVGAYATLGMVALFIGALMIAFGFRTEDGGHFAFHNGWNSRKKQGLILAVAGATLMQLNKLLGILLINGLSECNLFPFVGVWAPQIGMVAMLYGIAQMVLNLINDDLGSKIWGARILVAGIAIIQIGPVIDFIFQGLY